MPSLSTSSVAVPPFPAASVARASKRRTPPGLTGSITGTITAANVVGPTAQGYAVGDLVPVVKAIRAGVTYANMHTANFPGGEIRGQVRHGHGEGHH